MGCVGCCAWTTTSDLKRTGRTRTRTSTRTRCQCVRTSTLWPGKAWCAFGHGPNWLEYGGGSSSDWDLDKAHQIWGALGRVRTSTGVPPKKLFLIPTYYLVLSTGTSTSSTRDFTLERYLIIKKIAQTVQGVCTSAMWPRVIIICGTSTELL